MRNASEIVRQLICLAYEVYDIKLPDDEENVSLWECMELYRLLLAGETRMRMGAGEGGGNTPHPSADADTLEDESTGDEERGLPRRSAPRNDREDACGDSPAGGMTVPTGAVPTPKVPAETVNANKAAAQFKKEIAGRLKAFRERLGLGCYALLAEASGGALDDDTIRRMADGEKFGIGEWRELEAALWKYGE